MATSGGDVGGDMPGRCAVMQYDSGTDMMPHRCQSFVVGIRTFRIRYEVDGRLFDGQKKGLGESCLNKCNGFKL